MSFRHIKYWDVLRIMKKDVTVFTFLRNLAIYDRVLMKFRLE